jgi:hypothetical protein
MALLRIVLPLVLLVVIIWLGVRAFRVPQHKCADCRHRRKIFPDGTLCGFGKRETFKNEVHVANCVDHQRV